MAATGERGNGGQPLIPTKADSAITAEITAQDDMASNASWAQCRTVPVTGADGSTAAQLRLAQLDLISTPRQTHSHRQGAALIDQMG